MQKSPNYTFYFWLVTLGLVISKVLFTLRPEIDLFTEEAQYWLWSQNMAWHYYSKPPLVAVANFISTAILGNTEIGVRINAFLAGIGVAWVVFRFGAYLYGERAGFWSAMVVQAMPFWWLASTFHMTDTAITFFWMLCCYLLYRAIKEDKMSWWILAGAAAALGLISKAVMLLIFPFLIFYLWISRSNVRDWKNALVFFLITSLGFIPVIVWNLQNNFDTFKHLAALGGAGGGDSAPHLLSNSLKWFLEYWSGQLAMISIFLLPAWYFALSGIFKSKNKTSLYLLLPGLMTFVAFGMLSLMKRVEVNWPVFSYTGFAIILGHWIVGQSKAWQKYFKVGIVLSMGIPLLFLLPDFTFIKSVKPIEKVEHKALSRLLGHEMLAERISFLRDSLSLENEFFFSDSYHTASELAFYLPDHPQPYVLNMGSRKNQFDLWEDMRQFVGKQNIGVFVSWSNSSPADRATFERFLYEESFTPTVEGIPVRTVKIQIWKNLQAYDPFIPTTY